MPVIKIRRGTTTQWNASSRVLQVGELGIDTTLNRVKAGNGVGVWSALPYLSLSSAEIEELSQDSVAAALAAGTHSNITVTYSDSGNSISLATGPDVITQTSLSNTLTNATTGYVSVGDVGQADGVASLDSNGKIPDSEIPAAIARLSSPALTGTPSAPLAVTGTNTTQVATTSFVQQELNILTTGAPAALNTLDELAAALGDDSNYAATITTALGNKQDKVSGVSDTEISYLDGVTSGIQSQLNSKESLLPGLSGQPTTSSFSTLLNASISSIEYDFAVGPVIYITPQSTFFNLSAFNNLVVGNFTLAYTVSGTSYSTVFTKANQAAADIAGKVAIPIEYVSGEQSFNVSSASITYGSGTAGKFLTNYGSSKYWSSIPVTSESTTTLLGTVYGKTSGSNYAIGQDLYPNLSTGTSNIAIGGASMYAIQGGNGNVAIGESAFAGLANMNYNVGIGLNVMFNAGANGGGNNVAIGANAGSAATGTVDNNVLIGSSAGGGVGVTGAMISGTNNILIGYQSIPSATDVSNEITLGNSSITSFRIPGLGIEWKSNPDIMSIMEAW